MKPLPIKALVAILVGIVAVGGLFFEAGLNLGRQSARPKAKVRIAPALETPIPNDALGQQIALGREIFLHTRQAAPQFVRADVACANCHLDAGRLANSAPLWGAYPMFPQYRAKNGHVNTFAERLQGCFMFSENGKAPPTGDPVLVALESYAAFLAKGIPLGARAPGQGYPKLDKPAMAPDYARGQQVYAGHCALCHGTDGQGQTSETGAVVFPPAWGPRSYNWGAGMSDLRNAAGFIKANMPFSQGGSLSDQQAWDAAAYIDSQPRPQDPRYLGSVAETRAKFHNDGQSMYGKTVNGVLLGGDGPPKGFKAEAADAD